MSPLDVQVIKRKLALIVQNLKALEPIVEMSAAEYSADIYRRKATERLLQELIEAAIGRPGAPQTLPFGPGVKGHITKGNYLPGKRGLFGREASYQYTHRCSDWKSST